MEAAVLALRRQFPAWGGRKLARVLRNQGHQGVPSPSTVTAILHRHGLIEPEASQAAKHWHRFEHDAPNDLWQMDFKGYFEAEDGSRCDALTVLDDHSRFSLVIHACKQPDAVHVRQALIPAFQRYGLPKRINADNGSPWGCPTDTEQRLSALSVWLIRQGITVTHSAPYHPQTNGKIERFHRSLQAEVLNQHVLSDLAHVQAAFDWWRPIYNRVRPHDSLGEQSPISRYTPSPRPYTAQLPPIEYSPNDIVMTVKDKGWIKFRGHSIRLAGALYKLPVALRPDPDQDGSFQVYFCHQAITRLDLSRTPTSN